MQSSRTRAGTARKATRPATRRMAAVAAGVVCAFAATALVALAAVSTPGTHIAKVGPTSPENGFPVWYADDSNPALRLALCDQESDPNCNIAGTLPDATQPQSFPGNYPVESFYQLASAVMNAGNGGKATFVAGLEATFNNNVVAKAGDQTVFSRIRVKVTNLAANTTYTVHHPYGDESLKTDGNGTIFFTQDVGAGSPNFADAMNSRYGPFLQWDPTVGDTPPAGYLADPAVNHKVIGSPVTDASGKAQNYFQLIGPDAGGPGVNTQTTDLFSLTGKLATTAGLSAQRVVDHRAANATGGTLDVYAQSDPGQAIQVRGSGFDPVALREDGSGQYFARVDYTGATPPSVDLVNAGDVPQTVKTIKVTDLVTATATYSADSPATLKVTAASSNLDAAPTLTAKGYGDLASGSGSFDVAAAPPEVTVTSSAGGSVTVPVDASGAAFKAIGVTAVAGPDQTVQQGQTVTLDATGSTGPVRGYSWKQTGGSPTVTLTGAGTSKATFTAPDNATAAPLDLTFQVTVDNGAGDTSTSTTTVHVAPVSKPVANAGPDQTVPQGSTVNLDGTGSTGASSYSWAQTGGSPTVTLTGANTATPSFTYPSGTTATLTFTLTASGPGGTSTDTMTVSGASDRLSLTSAKYTIGKAQYDIRGTASQTANNRITIHKGATLAGPVIGTTTVDNLGAWRFKDTSTVALAAGDRISIESSRGGTLLDQATQVSK
jgi:K319-like protein